MRRLVTSLRKYDFARVIGLALIASPIEAVKAAYWYATGRRVRGINLAFEAATQNSRYYRLWMKAWEPKLIDRLVDEVAYPAPASPTTNPEFLFLILGTVQSSSADFAFTRASIAAGFGPAIQIIEISPPSADDVSSRVDLQQILDDRPSTLASRWLVVLAAGDAMHPRAGDLLKPAAHRAASSIIYWDEDRLDGQCRTDPFLKPAWDDLLFLSRDTLSGSAAFRLSAIASAASSLTVSVLSPESIAELSIALAARSESPPLHVPAILSHRRSPDCFAQIEWRQSALDRHWPVHVELHENDEPTPICFPRFPLAAPAPRVSIIIPTRDKIELLRNCLEGLERTVYPGELEIIVADNGSVDPEALAYLENIAANGTKIYHHPGPFNYSRINNEATRVATGELLCLLNNDIEMIDERWLLTLVEHAMRPGVGAVGAMLLYPDRTIQHAGVAVGVGGAAGHVHRGLSLADRANGGIHRRTRRMSAVTAACLLLRRDLFQEVGGLDEEAFAVAFNDVDLCLKIGSRGLVNVFVGDAVLIHHESKSRGSDSHPANAERFARELHALQSRWHTKTFDDPFHHPLLLLTSERYALAPA